ncbi:MAG TPA: hypothetical protein VM925_09970, partial [Labilithrix sp.]|nr:hypothetical protein [Labilithrix sp.]
MLLSRRMHQPRIGSASLTCERVIAPSFLFRRVEYRELVQDERITKPFVGADSERNRHRILVMLDGKSYENVGGVETSVIDGEAFYTPAHCSQSGRYGGAEILEIEWDPGSMD